VTGAFFGSYFFGKASDMFGWRKTFIFAVVGQSLFGISAGIMPSKFLQVFSEIYDCHFFF